MTAVEAPGATRLVRGPEGPDVEHRHLAGLDGLRAVAVTGVLLFHAGAGWFGGGLLGVDVFFVLSGFLITTLLVGEWARTGTIAFGGFYARRARRLLPGLIILVLMVAAYARWVAPAGMLETIRADAFSTLAYMANWRFVFSHQSYFVHYGPPSPLLHTWSLAVEEQFYLVWPVVAWIVLRRFGRRALAGVAAVALLASAVVTGVLFATGSNATSLYYGTGTRVQEVMAGALLAVAVPRLARRLGPPGGRRATVTGAAVAVAGVGGAVFLVWALHRVAGDGEFLYEGGFMLVAAATVAVIAVVALRPRDPLGRLLALGALGYIGRISYGLYLYHYPLFLVLDSSRTHLSGAWLLALRLGVTLAAAVVSYHLVELPIRRRRFPATARTHPWGTAGAGVAGAAALAAVVLLATVTPPALPPAQAAVRARPALFAVPARPPSGLGGAHQVRVLLLGDSLAYTLGQGLSENSAAWGVRILNMGFIGCDLDPHSIVNIQGVVGPPPQGCSGWQQSWPRDVAWLHPDVVGIELGRWEVTDRIIGGRWMSIGQRPWDELFAAELTQAIAEVSADGVRVALFTMPYVDPPTAAPNGQPWDFNLPGRVDAYNTLIRAVAGRFPGVVTVVDLNHLLDPNGSYSSYLDGVDVRTSDQEHLSVAGGELLRPDLLTQLVALGRPHERVRTAEGTR